MAKADSAPSPFAVGRHDIFGYEDNLRMLADQLVVIGVGIWSDQRQHGCAVRRRNADPALSGLKADIKGQSKTELIKIESQASILIAYIHIDSVHAEIRVLPFLAKVGLIHHTEGRGAGHGDKL